MGSEESKSTALGESMRRMNPEELAALAATLPDMFFTVHRLKNELEKCFEAISMWNEIDRADAEAFGRYVCPDWLSWRKELTRDNILEDLKSVDDLEKLADRVESVRSRANEYLLRIGGMKMPKELLPVVADGGVATLDGHPILYTTAEGHLSRGLQAELRSLECSKDPSSYPKTKPAW